MKLAKAGRTVTVCIVGASLFLSVAAMGAGSSQPSTGSTDDTPRLPCPTCIPAPEFPEDVPVPGAPKPRCGTHDGWQCCQDSCAGGMRCVREERRVPTSEGGVRTVAVKVCRLPPPPRIREAHSEHIELGGGVFGVREERTIGGACPDGTTRTSCAAEAEGGGQCYAVDSQFGNGWVSDSPTDCRCHVHLGVPAFQTLTCSVHVNAKLSESQSVARGGTLLSPRNSSDTWGAPRLNK